MTRHWKLAAGALAGATALSAGAVAFADSDRVACGCAPELGATVADTVPEPDADVPTASTSEHTITVPGSGTVQVEPDTAVVNLGIQIIAPTGAEAMEQVNADAAALTEALVASGIAEEDIQTSGLNLWGVHDETGVEITAYNASLSVTVTIHDIDAVGPTIDAAQTAGGEGFTIGGLSFSFADPESVLEQARIDALASARVKAEQYAAAAGVELGAIVRIVESPSSPPIIFGDMARMEAAAADAAGPPIAPGQLDLTLDISVTFAIS